ncbi:MAG TPA: NAD(P) transhydrogenase subunit beta, partial [Microbacteriaceae bacterium]|nr:NAD(P) transhydrogenase subunit beta [Microbacteriaceae bacterium]
MSLITVEVEALLYLFAAVMFIMALKGLSSPKSARRGNLLGALGALVGIVTVFLAEELHNVGWILLVIGVGSIISVPASRMVKMTQMPQLVALFNGVGGGAAAIVALP